MIESINHEDIELIDNNFKKIMEKYKTNDIFPILKYGYNNVINTMNKKMEEFEYYINYKDIRIDIYLFPLIKYLIDNHYDIKSCSYYRSINKYCSTTFSSIDSGLMFIDKNIIRRNSLYKRVESSLSFNIINKWLYNIHPYNKSANDQKYDIDFTFTILMQNDDINLIYNILNNKNILNIPHNSYNNAPLFKKSKQQLLNYINEINNIKNDSNNIIINKILDNSTNYIHKLLLQYFPYQKIILKFKNSTYKIHEKLISLIKELLIANLEVNDDDCYYDDTYTNLCCISFPFYAHAIEFIHIILTNNIKDDFYKKILNLSKKNNWIYETSIIDINIKNNKKPDYFPSINIKFIIDDLNIIINRIENHNSKVNIK
jgi:hypothetical protein